MNFGDSSHKTVKMLDCFWSLGSKTAHPSWNRVDGFDSIPNLPASSSIYISRKCRDEITGWGQGRMKVCKEDEVCMTRVAGKSSTYHKINTYTARSRTNGLFCRL